MKNATWGIGCFLLLVASWVQAAKPLPAHLRPAPQPAMTVTTEAHPEYLLVGYHSKLSRENRLGLHARSGASLSRSFERIAVDVVRIGDPGLRDTAMNFYRGRPEVAFIEPNYRVQRTRVPNDPQFSSLWGLRNTGQTGGTPGADIGITNVWATLTTGATNILVAVIDTGIDYTHPDLIANMWVNPGETANGEDDDGNGIIDDLYGARWTGGNGQPTSGDPMDGDGHGTHVAGTIGAVGDNGIGVAGVAWQVQLMALKFLDDSGSGWTADAIAALDYALEKGAHLSNNSWGGGGYSQALKNMIDAAADQNHLFVAAAGNSGVDIDQTPAYPAAYTSPNLLAVASSDDDDLRSFFSNYGKLRVGLAAPGRDILSSVPGGIYEEYSGTSMASPHVAGAAALLMGLYPTASFAEIRAWLIDGATPRKAWASLSESEGRLNVAESARLSALPPGTDPVEDFAASSGPGDTSISLSWSLPPGQGFDRLVVRRSGTDYPRHWNDGTLVVETALDHFEDGPFVEGERFYYGTWAVYTNLAAEVFYSAGRFVSRRVGGDPDDFFTEWFSVQDNDLAFTTVTFLPDGSVNGYEAFADPATEFPTDPSGGFVLDLNDDDFERVELPLGVEVWLHGVAYDHLYIGANGYITFDQGDLGFWPILAEHFRLPRISVLYDDFNPATGGTISWVYTGDRIAITYEDVPEYGVNNQNSFQAELFMDGRIRLTWLDLGTRDGLVGLSAGAGIPFGFSESDFSAYPSSDDLRMFPHQGWSSTGEEGGPFDPEFTTYSLTNRGASTFTWTASTDASWLTVEPSGGVLSSGSATTLTVTIRSSATNLTAGWYPSTVLVSNQTSGNFQTLPMSLFVTRDGMSALFFADGFMGDNPVLPALWSLGYPVREADSWSEFNQSLATGEVYLAVALIQRDESGLDLVGFENHLASGGRALVVDWTEDLALGALLQSEYTGVHNQSPVTLLEVGLADGVSNPMSLVDPGWFSRWSMGLTAMNEAQGLARFPNGDDAVVWGHQGRTALLGFMADTLLPGDGQPFFENLLGLLETGSDGLFVTPTTPWMPMGYELGPFAPTSRTYQVSNSSSNSFFWSASVTSAWLAVQVAGGELAGGGVDTVTLGLTSVADTLAPGIYRDTLTVSNLTSGRRLVRDVALVVKALPGEIMVVDSVSPFDDLFLPFPETLVGLYRTETVTVHNVDDTYGLVVEAITILSQVASPPIGPTLNPLPYSPSVPAAQEGPALDLRDESYVPHSLLVGFNPGEQLAARDVAHAAVGATRVHRYRRIATDVVQIPKDRSIKEMIEAYLALPGVVYAEPNDVVRAFNPPSDPRFGDLWGLHNTGQSGGTPGADIRALDAWTITTGSEEIIVAVIDTGIDYTHPDLAANLWINPGETANGQDDDGNGIIDDLYGARWVNGNGQPTSGDPMDGDGHGTHVAGTIGAVGNNGIGVVGVNWSVRLMALKFLDDSGFGATADAVAALEYAIDQGAHLSNNSWGGGGYSQTMRNMITAAAEANQLFVAAAGNDNRDNDLIPSYPASYPNDNIISVASGTRSNTRSSFSSFGLTSVDLAAPGSSILSTLPGGAYGEFSGTSMASPHVAGVAALLLSLNPNISYDLVKQAILDGVDLVPAWFDLTLTGGTLNAIEALQKLNPNFRLDGLAGFPFSIAPGESFSFTVMYRPIETGSHTSVVRILSNDTNQPSVDVLVTGSAAKDDLEILPEAGLVVTGPPGGPFVPDQTSYILTNTGPSSIGWTAAATESWLSVLPASRTLVGGDAIGVTVALTSEADLLPTGSFSANVLFGNVASGVQVTRSVSLTVAYSLCEAVDDCTRSWTTGGSQPWNVQAAVTFDGEDAVQSGAVDHNQSSWIETIVDGPGEISFRWKVSSEANFDYLDFYVNGVLIAEISGEQDWALLTHVVGPGTSTLRWEYDKDLSVDAGADAGWLDQFAFTPIFATDAYDEAGHYGAFPSNFVNGANQGNGFLPWELLLGPGAVAVLGDATQATGDINSSNQRAFRLYGGNNTYVDAIRPFSLPLGEGDTFSTVIGYNWNGGARGFNLLDHQDIELMNVNFGGADVLSFKWGSDATARTLSTSWSATAVLSISVIQLEDNELAVTLTRNDGFTTNLVSDGLWAPAAKAKFYNGGHPANSVNYALHANNLSIVRAILDRDNDGLPDWWEVHYFGGATNAVATSLAANQINTLLEAFVAQIDPTHPSAFFEVSSPDPGSLSPLSLRIDPSNTGRVYWVEWVEDLSGSPNWTPVPPEQPGTGSAMTFPLPLDATGRTFRAGVKLP